MRKLEDIVNESLPKGSNALSDVIARLQELEKEYGGDIKVIADTQDGANYDVIADNISVEDYTAQGNKKVKYVCIQ